MIDGLRQKLSGEQVAIGCWSSIGGPVAGELVGRAGYDFAVCDTQHGALGWEALLPTIQAIELGGTPVLVRTGWNDPMQVMRALDLGAAGVIVPMVSTPEAARLAASASRYPPAGERSFGPVRSTYAAGETAGEPLCFVMIETAEALGHLDAIVAEPGIDGLFLGPVDLALSLGLGAALKMPEAVLRAAVDIVAACGRHGKIAGCAALGNGAELAARGMRLLTISSDAVLVRRGAAADVEAARSWAREA